MAKTKLRIAIYETPEKIIEGGYGDFYNTLDRETAIEKISQELLMSDLSTMDHKEIAEAALNALLEK